MWNFSISMKNELIFWIILCPKWVLGSELGYISLFDRNASNKGKNGLNWATQLEKSVKRKLRKWMIILLCIIIYIFLFIYTEHNGNCKMYDFLAEVIWNWKWERKNAGIERKFRFHVIRLSKRFYFLDFVIVFVDEMVENFVKSTFQAQPLKVAAFCFVFPSFSSDWEIISIFFPVMCISK